MKTRPDSTPERPERRTPSLAARVVRRLLRAIYPEYEGQQESLAQVRKSVGKIQAEVQEHRHHSDELMRAAMQRIEKAARAEDLKRLRQELSEVSRRLERQGRASSRLLRRGDARSEPTHDERLVLQRLERVARSARPIVVGPWSGEVGFELLYWIPFVRWFQQKYDIDPARMIVLSRGGVGSWYAHISRRYVEAFDYVSTGEFREATLAIKKQRGVTALDVRLLRRVVRAEGLGRVHLLHPAAMYRLFWQFWKENASVKRVDQYSAHQPLAGDDRAELPAGLPADYVAVRFYFSTCFPDTPANREFAASIVSAIAETTDVVLLNTPFAVDDHSDAGFSHPRVHVIGDMPAPRNLAIQTAVLRRARLFVGTYGGYAYLAPLYGVPSIAFHSNREFFQHHLDLAQRVFDNLGSPSLVALSTADADMLRLALPPRRHGMAT